VHEHAQGHVPQLQEHAHGQVRGDIEEHVCVHGS